DGKMLAVTYVNGENALWDPASGNLVRAWASGADEVYTVDWNRKGDVLVCAGRNGKLTLWKAADQTLLNVLPSPEWVTRVRFSPDGSRLLSSGGGQLPGSPRKVVIWSLASK